MNGVKGVDDALDPGAGLRGDGVRRWERSFVGGRGSGEGMKDVRRDYISGICVHDRRNLF